MEINLLDSMIINRISAGEVVESPFSIVKELIDNSLDAGADKIYVEIKNGGIDQIIVKDNGKGIDYEDIIKAFLPHATSKIKDITDLEEILTLGFRGEALASISNVSQTTLTTKTETADCAYTLDVFGGNFGDITPTSSEQGTKIEVNNLFFNTPARRKFLRKPKQEETQITNILTRYILAHPEISFKYVVDGKTVYQTRGNKLIDAICCVYGAEISHDIMYVEKNIDGIKLSGYVSKVGFSKPNTTHQTLMINSRYVIDEIVSKACFMAYEEYLMPRQFPFYVLKIDMPARDVDVNVHPSKMNVKFANPSRIYDLVYTAVRAKIYESLNPTIIEEQPKTIDSIDNSLIKTDLSSLQEISIEPTTNLELNRTISLKQESFSPITMFELAKETPVTQQNVANSNAKQEKLEETSYVDFNDVVDYKVVGQIFEEFLVLEKGDNMILLDFHAGHERLNYDKFTNMVNNREVVIQSLLVPYTQELSELELDFVLNLKEKLNELGFEIDSFGDKKVIINSIPMQLKDINLKNFIDDLIHDMKNLNPAMNNEIKHYLMQKACKSSVKAGMTLNDQEIKSLLKDLDLNNPVLLCPHGRPVVTVIPKSKIEKRFKRIV